MRYIRNGHSQQLYHVTQKAAESQKEILTKWYEPVRIG